MGVHRETTGYRVLPPLQEPLRRPGHIPKAIVQPRYAFLNSRSDKTDIQTAKNMVMAMLYLDFPMKSADLDVWIKPTSQRLDIPRLLLDTDNPERENTP